ncbi:MAG TPA: OmpA family protein [Puia sp.]|nr:OmpA family protein [Puia sp.]
MPFLNKSVLFLLLPLAVLHTHAQQQKADTLLFHFGFDRSDIHARDSQVIRNYFMQHLKDYGPADSTYGSGNPYLVDSAVVIGYTDTVGGRAYNQHLSERRARAVMLWVMHFLPQERPQANHFEGRGKSEPLPGDDSLSRRVVVIVYYHDKPATAVARVDTPPPTHPDGEPDTTLSLDNINFIANTPVLTDAAREAMPTTIRNLRTYSDRYLEIDGFCNAPGPPLPPKDPLFKLSVQRAKYIYDLLIQSGFDSTRLRYKGLGNTRSVNPHPTTAAEMDQNMRVEIKVFRKPPVE